MTSSTPQTAARFMYDSVDASAIPAGAEMVAGYVDGAYQWSAADWALFPNAVKVRIATQPSTDDGDVLDIERGDAIPQDAPKWIRMRQAAGLTQPSLYCANSVVGTVRELCAGLLYSLWIADWTGVPHPLSYASAVQYADSKMLGINVDESIVYDAWWPGPHQPPATGGDPLDLDTARSIVHVTLSLQGLLGDQAQVDAYATAMVPPNNPEAALTQLESDIKADPRSLYSRTVAHLGTP